MLDRIHNLPITGLYDFSERYKLVKRAGDELERDKLIEAAYLAIRAIEAGKPGKYLRLRASLEVKVSPRPNGARIFYDRKSRTTRTWDDLILAHTTAEIAADAFQATEKYESSTQRTLTIWCRRDGLKWRRDADTEMLLFRCKRVILQPHVRDALAEHMFDENPWIRSECKAELAAREALDITRALDERDSHLRTSTSLSELGEAESFDSGRLLSPWPPAGVFRSASQSVMRL